MVEVEDLARRHGGRVEVVEDPVRAVKEADIVYADSWMPYRIAKEEEERRTRDLRPYQVDGHLFSQAPRQALFMHCLPAMRGQEVTAEVIDGKQSIVFDQAENRLHIQKAVLLELLGEAHSGAPTGTDEAPRLL